MSSAKTKTPAKQVITKKNTTAPWERDAKEKRFDKQRIFISGKFEELRKDEVVKVLQKEGATIESKLGASTNVFVYSSPGSADQKRAEKMKADGADLQVVSEDQFRKRYILPTPE